MKKDLVVVRFKDHYENKWHVEIVKIFTWPTGETFEGLIVESTNTPYDINKFYSYNKSRILPISNKKTIPILKLLYF